MGLWAGCCGVRGGWNAAVAYAWNAVVKPAWEAVMPAWEAVMPAWEAVMPAWEAAVTVRKAVMSAWEAVMPARKAVMPARKAAVPARKTCGFPRSRASPYASISWKKCQQAAIFPIYGCALLIAYVYIISYISEFGRESLYEMKKCDKESGLLAVWKI